MHSFITYDSSGAITAVYRVGNQDLATAMTANTPAGQSALAVSDDSPALAKPSAYKVVSGAIVAA